MDTSPVFEDGGAAVESVLEDAMALPMANNPRPAATSWVSGLLMSMAFDKESNFMKVASGKSGRGGNVSGTNWERSGKDTSGSDTSGSDTPSGRLLLARRALIRSNEDCVV